ncbi:MAG TPA: LytR C-terminal domain-containing protein [Mycobacteriales bacterium]
MFLTSNVGGGLAALASVLLVVLVVLAMRGKPADTADSTAQAGQHQVTASAEPTSGPTSGTSGIGGANDGPTSGSASSGADSTGSPAEPPGIQGPIPGSTGAAPGFESGQPAHSRPALTVLNNTTVRGLAHRAADRFATDGWSVAQVGNYAGNLPTTTVYFTPGNADEQRAAEALARAYPKITRVLPHDPHLPVSARGVIVVVAPNWLT